MNLTLSYNQYKYGIFGILATAYILVYFHRLCAAVVAVDMMNDFKTGGALMGLLGVGGAMLFVPTMKILAEWFRAKEFATMTGVLIAMGGVGTLIATSPLALLSNAVGWRFSFVIIGIITIVCAALVWLVCPGRSFLA